MKNKDSIPKAASVRVEAQGACAGVFSHWESRNKKGGRGVTEGIECGQSHDGVNVRVEMLMTGGMQGRREEGGEGGGGREERDAVDGFQTRAGNARIQEEVREPSPAWQEAKAKTG